MVLGGGHHALRGIQGFVLPCRSVLMRRGGGGCRAKERGLGERVGRRGKGATGGRRVGGEKAQQVEFQTPTEQQRVSAHPRAAPSHFALSAQAIDWDDLMTERASDSAIFEVIVDRDEVQLQNGCLLCSDARAQRKSFDKSPLVPFAHLLPYPGLQEDQATELQIGSNRPTHAFLPLSLITLLLIPLSLGVLLARMPSNTSSSLLAQLPLGLNSAFLESLPSWPILLPLVLLALPVLAVFFNVSYQLVRAFPRPVFSLLPRLSRDQGERALITSVASFFHSSGPKTLRFLLSSSTTSLGSGPPSVSHRSFRACWSKRLFLTTSFPSSRGSAYGMDPYKFYFDCRAKVRSRNIAALRSSLRGVLTEALLFFCCFQHGDLFTFILIGRKVTVALGPKVSCSLATCRC